MHRLISAFDVQWTLSSFHQSLSIFSLLSSLNTKQYKKKKNDRIRFWTFDNPITTFGAIQQGIIGAAWVLCVSNYDCNDGKTSESEIRLDENGCVLSLMYFCTSFS